MGQGTFIVATPGRFVTKFAHAIELPSGARVRLTAEGHAHLTLEVSMEHDLSDTVSAEQLAERIASRLSFELDIPLEAPCRPYYDLAASIVGDFPMDGLVECLDSSTWGAESSEFLAGCNLYRESVLARDPIAGFMLMWNLLVMLTGSEIAADAAVERHSPEVEIRHSRKRRRCTVVLDAKDTISHLVHRPAHRPAPNVTALRGTLQQVGPYMRTAVRAELEAMKSPAPVEQRYRADGQEVD